MAITLSMGSYGNTAMNTFTGKKLIREHESDKLPFFGARPFGMIHYQTSVWLYGYII